MNEGGRSRVRRRWLWLAVVALCILLGGYFLVPAALTSIAGTLVRIDPPTHADVIVALGGDARCLREKRAAELYLQKLAPRVIVSGVPSAWGINTGDAAKRYLVTLGVPETDILVLRESYNTRIEAISVSEIMKTNGWSTAVIVTSPFHSRRALLTFNRYGRGNTFYSSPLPEKSPEWQRERWWSRRGDMGTTVRELIAWANTLVGGLK